MRLRPFFFAAIASTILAARTGYADGPEDDAKAEYKLGEDLEAAGRLPESCVHYRKALTLLRVSGPLRKSAQCDARDGKVRDALSKYDELLAMLGGDNPKRAEYQAEQKQLAAKLAKITLVPRPSAREKVTATVDGAPAAVGAPIDADPGSHDLRVTFDGETSDKKLALAAGQHLEVQVPFTDSSDMTPLRIAGIVSLGLAGGAVIGIAVTGGLVLSAKGSADDACGANAQSAACTDEIDNGNTLLTANLALWIVGGVTAATGATLLIIDAVGSKPAASTGIVSARIAFGPGGIAVSGSIW